ncbi:MAG TPA: shikimate kinase [Vicinamibacteria bacterium]|nr:shikimate kinase [Vicinamibacteria bacterium]
MKADAVLRELGGRVRRRRSQRGLTLKELAERSGLSVRFLVEVEAGRGNPSLSSLVALAGALDLTLPALLESSAPPPAIALLGLRGAGKTTIGQRLAKRLKLAFVELDREVEEAAGLSLNEIFDLHGEAYFRRVERDTLSGLLAAERPLVLAVGGGLVTAGDTYDLLRRQAFTVWLRATPEDHWNRVVRQGDRRPMRDHPEAMVELSRLLASRESLYAQADCTVDTSRLGLDGALRAIVKAVGLRSHWSRSHDGAGR